MGTEENDKDNFLKAFEEESDAFFDSLLTDAGVAAPAPQATLSPKAAAPAAVAAAPAAAAPAASVAAAAPASVAPMAQASAQGAASAASLTPTAPSTPAPTDPPKKTAPGEAADEGGVAKVGTGSAAASAEPSADAGLRTPFQPPERAAAPAPDVKRPDDGSSATGPPASTQKPAPGPGSGRAPDPAEPALEGQQRLSEGAAVSAPEKARAAMEKHADPPPRAAPRPVVETFKLDDEDDEEDAVCEEAPAYEAAEDFRPPEVPPAPADFTAEDLALREALKGFYLRFRPDNLANVNQIVAKYRGRLVVNLWAQLCLKYDIPATEGVELLSQTLYRGGLFEYADDDQADAISKAAAEVRSAAPVAGTDQAELIRRSIQRGADNGSDDVLRILCFRGIPDEGGLRPQVWKVLLGYLPMARYSEWNAIQGEKRALYASYKSELLATSEDHKELMQEIQNDVDRTRRDLEYFLRDTTRSALLALLFVYARLNPGVRYVQGMNEVAAVILYVMAAGDAESAEADAFWCFSELMVEIKEGFMQALDHTDQGVYALTEGVARLLRSYDPELARHLQKSELPPFVFVLRWCTVLFAQDCTLPDCVRLWDSFIGDPRRFEFVVHVCVTVILNHREELLRTDKQFELAEVLQSAAKEVDWDSLVQRAWAVCAYERRRGGPIFPPRATNAFADELSEWAQTAAEVAQEAAAKAQEVGEVVSRSIQETIAPAVSEKAGQASAAVAQKAQEVQTWLEDTAPARHQAMEQAQTRLSSFWDTARAAGAAAMSKGANLVDDRAVETARGKLTTVADSASTSAGSLFARAAAAAAALSTSVAAGDMQAPAPAVHAAPATEPAAADSSAPSLVPAPRTADSPTE